MKTNTNNKEGTHEIINMHALPEIQESSMQVAMVLLVATAAIVGIWGLVSLVAGIAMEGGLIDMARGWISAVTGS